MGKTIKKSKEFIKLCEKYGVDPDNVPEIMSVDAAYTACGYDRANSLIDASKFPARHQQAIMDTADLFMIHEAFNKDPETGALYEPNWNDSSEDKWGYWWDMEKDKNNPSGFRFHDSGYVNVTTRSAGGSRLCNRNEDIDKFIGNHFSDLFRGVMVFEKK